MTLARQNSNGVLTLGGLPTFEDWLAELAALPKGAARDDMLQEMRTLTRAAGACGSLQTANGLPCRRPTKVGYTVCRKHGDRAPGTIAKAERLLASVRMPAIGILADICEQWDEAPCRACGFPNHSVKDMKVFVQTATRVLDRTGMGPRQTVDVNARHQITPAIDVARLTPDELVELDAVLAAMDRFTARVKERLAQEVLAPAAGNLLSSPLD